jgi:hypothetical protein
LAVHNDQRRAGEPEDVILRVGRRLAVHNDRRRADEDVILRVGSRLAVHKDQRRSAEDVILRVGRRLACQNVLIDMEAERGIGVGDNAY